MTHVLTIHGWIPTRLNRLFRRGGSALKRRDRRRVAVEARFQEIPKATTRRSLLIEITYAKGDRSADPDAYYKSAHDACKHAGLIVDDTVKWLKVCEPVYLPTNPRHRTDRRMTRIILEDL